MIYVGKRSKGGCVVRAINENDPEAHKEGVDLFSELIGESLPTCINIRNHSPDGFEWGYRGSGPSQLALALLVHATGDKDVAMRLYGRFRDAAVVSLKDDTWMLSKDKIVEWVNGALLGPPGVEDTELVKSAAMGKAAPTSTIVTYSGNA